MNAPDVLPNFTAWLEGHRSIFDAIVLDIDGVMINENSLIQNSLQFLNQLRLQRIPFILLTNDGSNSHREKCGLLAGAGIVVSPDEIISASDALANLAREQPDLQDKMFYIIGRLGNPSYAVAAGIRLTDNLSDLPQCAGLIVGEGDYEWEPVFHGALNWLRKNHGRHLIVPNPDEYFLAANGDIKIGAGAFARFIARTLANAGITVEPVYLGKPHRPIFQRCHLALEERLQRNVPRERVIMLGDSLSSDVQGAKNFGYQAALVLTGVTSLAMLAAGNPKPDWVFKTL